MLIILGALVFLSKWAITQFLNLKKMAQFSIGLGLDIFVKVGYWSILRQNRWTVASDFEYGIGVSIWFERPTRLFC